MLVALVATSVAMGVAQPTSLTTLRALHQLTNAQARAALPVDFQGTVTFASSSDHVLFVQDGDAAIDVKWSGSPVSAGDRVEVKGVTAASFRPVVNAESVTVLGHGALPLAAPATYDQLIRADYDARLVTVTGTVRDAVSQVDDSGRRTRMQLRTDGGEITVNLSLDNPDALSSYLDADVLVTGVESGSFDGKLQQTGVTLYVSGQEGVKILRPAAVDPWSLPVTPMDRVVAAYHVNNLSRRVRVHGTITYYQPGSAAVLQDGSNSLWLATADSNPLRIGDTADATGFPDIRDGLLTLSGSAIRDLNISSPVQPVALTWDELGSGRHVYDLVSIDGKVVASLRTATQDEYVLDAGGNLFSAIYRHNRSGTRDAAPVKQLAAGSKVRVVGVCIMSGRATFDSRTSFNILLRSPDDLTLLAGAPLITVSNLVRVVAVLVLGMLAFAVWGWTLRRRVRQQTADIMARSEADAAQERRIAQLEQWRSRILEDINSSRPLSDIVEHITEMVSFMLNGAPCWCDVNDGPRLGRPPARKDGFRIISRDVPSRTGLVLATLFAALDYPTPNEAEETEALSAGVRLATLSIETRKLYSDLLHRSEFDLLTDMHNRFSLDRHLQELIERARETNSTFGLIYVDLDDFKLVNDLYGHHVGDLYLQEVSLRMKRQLRTGDMLGRLGGDEFAALVTVARGPADVEDIAQRLERCFDAPFTMNGYVLRGSASVGLAIYPADGATSDALLTAADAAMYQAKNSRRATGQIGTRQSS
ncbi:MAG: diguanylate cyclase [Terracidiphilus sp.]|nr:diguanylate cyclase [Terracidiphilus sp.]